MRLNAIGVVIVKYDDLDDYRDEKGYYWKKTEDIRVFFPKDGGNPVIQQFCLLISLKDDNVAIDHAWIDIDVYDEASGKYV